MVIFKNTFGGCLESKHDEHFFSIKFLRKRQVRKEKGTEAMLAIEERGQKEYNSTRIYSK